MRFRVENLGPLREAEVDLSKDLIVLTGPNNTGKTYLAWTVYGLFKVGMEKLGVEGEPVLDEFVASDKIELNLGASTISWGTLLGGVAKECRAALPHIFAGYPGHFASANLALTAPVDHLAQDRRDPAFAMWGPGYVTFSAWKSHAPTVLIGLLQIDTQGQPQAMSDIAARANFSQWNWREDEFLRVSSIPAGDREKAVGARRARLAVALKRRIFSPCILFPAERIAVNIFAKELALKRTELVSELLEALPTTDPADLLQRRAGRYPWPIRDSLHVAVDLQNLSRERTSFADLADELERAVLGGTVGVSDLGELTFAPGGAPDRHLAVHLTASVVKSLSSLVFYFRHIARRGDFLIIDEPELNLHPDNQRKITRLLVKAVRRGFKIMMSTHSDYVLRELNHLVMLSKGGEAAERVIDELGYDRETLLTPDRVGVYLFNEHTARAVEVDETGFEVETIEREIAAMNADAQRIYAALFG